MFPDVLGTDNAPTLIDSAMQDLAMIDSVLPDTVDAPPIDLVIPGAAGVDALPADAPPIDLVIPGAAGVDALPVDAPPIDLVIPGTVDALPVDAPPIESVILGATGAATDADTGGERLPKRRRKTKDYPKSKYKHVYWSSKQNKWNVRVRHPVTQKQSCASFVDDYDAACDADCKLYSLYLQDNSLKNSLKFNFIRFDI